MKSTLTGLKDTIKLWLTDAVTLRPTKDGERGWPGFLFGGRVRTSTVVLLAAFCAVWWTYETYKPEPEAPSPAPQVVPPGFVPDPNYTWVPRTRLQQPPSTVTVTKTPPPSTTTLPPPTTTTPPPFQLPALPPPFGPSSSASTPPPPAPLPLLPPLPAPPGPPQ